MMQRIAAPVGHLASKAKPGSRHVALALDKPTLDRERGAVSGKHGYSDKTPYHRLDAARSDRLLTGADKGLLRMFGPVLLDDIRQRTQRLPPRAYLVEPPLQEGQHQMEYSIPLLDGFVGLHSEVPQAQHLFEVPVVDFQGPTVAIPDQYRLCRQVQVCAQEVLRVLVPIVPSGDQYADIEGDIAQTPLHRAHQVGAGGAICSGNPDTGVPLVLQPLIPLVDSDTIQLSVALEGANDMPALPAYEFDQLARSIPAVEQDVDRIPFWKKGLEFFQHLSCQTILALETQTLFFGSLAVESPYRLLSQVKPPSKGITVGADLDAQRDVHSALAVSRLPFPRCRVIKDPINRFLRVSVLVFAYGGVVNTGSDDGLNSFLCCSLQHIGNDERSQRSIYLIRFPGTDAEEVCHGTGIGCLHPLPIQIGKRFSPLTDDDCIRCAEQVLALRLGKVQMHQCYKRDKNSRWVYNSFQHGAASWFGTGLGFSPSLPGVAPSCKSV